MNLFLSRPMKEYEYYNDDKCSTELPNDEKVATQGTMNRVTAAGIIICLQQCFLHFF
jgi:hypothetical protein